MGVKDVWHETGPCEERISLNSLRGSTLAIDLAGWVVQVETMTVKRFYIVCFQLWGRGSVGESITNM